MEMPSETPMKPDSSDKPIGMSMDEIELSPLKKFFDVTDTSQDKNLETILGWAQSKGITDRANMQLELRRIEMKLGATDLGENRVARLARYLILDGKLSQTMKEMQSYES